MCTFFLQNIQNLLLEKTVSLGKGGGKVSGVAKSQGRSGEKSQTSCQGEEDFGAERGGEKTRGRVKKELIQGVIWGHVISASPRK